MAQEVKNDSTDDVAKSKKSSDEYLLDIVFVFDCTGSMASYINSARDNIVKVAQELNKLSKRQSKKSNNDKDKDKVKNKDKDKNKEKNNDDMSNEGQIEGMVDDVTASAADKKEQEKEEKQDDDESKSNPEPKKRLSCQFAVVAYRDHPPQDKSFITQIRDFTSSSKMIEKYLSTLSANGGGDGPECLTTALYDTLHNLKYRKNSQKIIIIITDAPCHGLDEEGDGFPDGDPFPRWKLAKKAGRSGINRHSFIGIKERSKDSGIYTAAEKSARIDNKMEDILCIARDITDKLEASFYTVACEPCISTQYDYARDLMEALAEMSNGKYVPLANANLLPKVIIGSVKQQMLIDEITDSIDKEIEELKIEYAEKNEQLTEDIITQFLEKKWENVDIKYKEVAIGTLYRKERRRDNIEFLLNRQKCQTLKDFRKNRIKFERLTHDDFRHLPSLPGSTSSSSSTTRKTSKKSTAYGGYSGHSGGGGMYMIKL